MSVQQVQDNRRWFMKAQWALCLMHSRRGPWNGARKSQAAAVGVEHIWACHGWGLLIHPVCQRNYCWACALP